MKTANTAWMPGATPQNGLGSPSLPSRSEMFELLAPEIVLPEQFHGESEALASRSGTKGLMLAILEDAIWCLSDVSSPSALRRMEARQAEMWIRERGSTWLFSFENICSVLDVDAERLRGRLLATGMDGLASQMPRRRLSHRVERGERRKRSAAARSRQAALASETKQDEATLQSVEPLVTHDEPVVSFAR